MSSEPRPAPSVPQQRPCPHCGLPMIASTPAGAVRTTDAIKPKKEK